MSNIKNEPPPIASFNDFFYINPVRKFKNEFLLLHRPTRSTFVSLLEHFYAMKNALKGTTAQT